MIPALAIVAVFGLCVALDGHLPAWVQRWLDALGVRG